MTNKEKFEKLLKEYTELQYKWQCARANDNLSECNKIGRGINARYNDLLALVKND